MLKAFWEEAMEKEDAEGTWNVDAEDGCHD
jgi:hypothetical protein